MYVLRFKDAFLKKAIFEVRHNANLLIIDNRGKVHKKWSEEFPETELRNEQIVMKNKDLPGELFVSATRFGCFFDDITNFSKFKDVAKKLSQQVSTLLEVNQYTRVGIRFFFVHPVDDLETLNSELSDNIFKVSDWSVFGNKLEEVNFTIRIKQGDLGYRFNFETTRRDENVEVLQGREKFYPELALLMDVDVYTKQPIEPKGVPQFIDKAEKSVETKLSQFFARFIEGGKNI